LTQLFFFTEIGRTSRGSFSPSVLGIKYNIPLMIEFLNREFFS